MIVSKGIGIDLGTTNSAVAMMDLSDADVILYRDAEGRATVPSCVWQDAKKPGIVVGYQAFARRGRRPQPVVSIKRRMGTQTTVQFAGQQVRPEVISSHILAALRDRMAGMLAGMATEMLTYLVDRAIITVPAYFDLPQIEATREAGKLAGLSIIELLHEPVAAAVYYSWKYNIPDGVFLVYDLGGGTLDVSVLRRTAGEFEVLGISGDNFLGGDDFDRLLAEWIRQRLVEDGYALDLDLEKNPEDALRFAGLVALAEEVKKNLTTQSSHLLRDQNTITDQNGDRVVIELQVTREAFESLIRNHIERTIAICWEALAKAHRKSDITLADIDYVCLVGGSTHVPLVQKTVTENLCACGDPAPASNASTATLLNRLDPALRDVVAGLISRNERTRCAAPIFDEPDACVALGAAVRAAASELHVYDDARRVRVRFRGQGSTTRAAGVVRGHVEAVDPALSLAGASIELALVDGGYVDEQVLRPDGLFRFDDVPLANASMNAYTLTIRDERGAQVGQVGRTLRQAVDHRDIGGVLSTAVLSKAILLEGVEHDRLTRAVLLPEGASLPARAEFRFELRDSSGKVRFPLYQATRVIKDVSVKVTAGLARGTPVLFTIYCDAQVNLRIEGRIGADSFDVPIGPPPPPAAPTSRELLLWREQFAVKVDALPGAEAAPLVERFEAILLDVEEALAGGDDPKAISKAADLEGLIKSIDLRMPDLEPPWATVQELIAEIDGLIQVAGDTLRGFDAAAARDQILPDLIEQARRASASHDQVAYQERLDALKAFRADVRRRLAEAKGPKRDVPPEIMAAALLQEISQKGQVIEFLCVLQGRQDLAAKVHAILAQVEGKRGQVRTAARSVSSWCFTVQTELTKVVGELRPAEQGDDATRDLVSFGQGQQIGLAAGLADGNAVQAG